VEHSGNAIREVREGPSQQTVVHDEVGAVRLVVPAVSPVGHVRRTVCGTGVDSEIADPLSRGELSRQTVLLGPGRCSGRKEVSPTIEQEPVVTVGGQVLEQVD
jgi:hypothetical protein